MFAIHGLIALAPAGIPRLNELHVDWRMAAFALLAWIISGAFTGGASAWYALRSDLFPLLKSGGAFATASGSRSRVRDGLVVAQLALALLLANGTGLLVRSLQRFSAAPLGLDTTNVMASLVYPQGSFSPVATLQLLDAAQAIPGVEHAALVGFLPLDASRNGWDDTVRVEGRSTTPTTPDVADVNWFSPGYLAATHIQLIKGRDFVSADGERTAPVAVVNQTFVARFLSGREPIGALVALTDWAPTTFTVVGVIQDVRQWGPGEPALPGLYLPEAQFARNAEAYGLVNCK